MAYFRVDYVCMANVPECCTMIRSAEWDRRFPNKDAVPQRWYCLCGARCKTKFGVIVEIVIAGKSHWVRATVPEMEMEDAKFMMLYNTPEALMAALPAIYQMDWGAFM